MARNLLVSTWAHDFQYWCVRCNVIHRTSTKRAYVERDGDPFVYTCDSGGERDDERIEQGEASSEGERGPARPGPGESEVGEGGEGDARSFERASTERGGHDDPDAGDSEGPVSLADEIGANPWQISE